MNLPRHTLSSHSSPPVFVNAQFANVIEEPIASTSTLQEEHVIPDERGRKGKQKGRPENEANLADELKDEGTRSTSMFACATRQGFFVARTQPLVTVSRREFPSIQGGLSHVALVDNTSLLILVGGGRVPRFAPNKVILWDEEATRVTRIPSEEKEGDVSTSFDGLSPRASTVFSVGQEEKAAGDIARSVTLSDAGSERRSEIVEGSDVSEKDITERRSSVLSREAIKENVGQAASTDKVDLEAPLTPPASMAGKGAHASQATEESAQRSPLSSSSRISNKQGSSRRFTSKGKEVAELEFGEAVKGICVKTFAIAGSEGGEVSKATLMVVQLDTKAVIFEMGPHVQYEAQAIPLGSQKGSWGIRQRLVVEIHPGLHKGIATMAPFPESNCVIIVLPGRQIGHVQILSIALSNAGRTSIRSSIAGASNIIAAHANPISSLTLSIDGRILCTTSERGTLLRLWSTFTSSTRDRSAMNLSTSLLCELRRGSDSAKIWSVAFSPDSLLIAVGSDKGTIHFFNLRPLHEALYSTSLSFPLHPPASPNSTSALLGKKANRFLPTSVQQVANSIPPSMLPQYFKSQWSFAQYKVPLKVFSNSVAEDLPRTSQPLFSTRRRDKGGMYDIHDPSSATLIGKQASLEGGWAGMKGRIDDVRRGEKGIEEGLWLTWVASDSDSLPKDAKTKRSSAASTTSKGKDGGEASRLCGYDLIAISSSGSHYRIGVALPASAHSSSSSSSTKSKRSSTVLNMYKEEAKTKSTKSFQDASSDDNDKEAHQDQCWLIEYRRFGMRDDWID